MHADQQAHGSMVPVHAAALGFGFEVAPIIERREDVAGVDPRAARIAKVLPAAQARKADAVALVVASVPTLALVPALAWAAHDGFHLRDLALGAGMYAFTLTGLSAGLHRLFAHRAFVAPRPVRALLAIAGSMCWQGPVIRWVADHRRHHAFTDEAGDPHSPHTGGGSSFRRFAHAHYSWFFDREKTRVSRFAPDLVRDPVICAIDRWYLLWALLSLAIPAALGGLWAGSSGGAVSALLWAGFVRIALLQHATWALNSVGHLFGSQPLATGDHSRNNAVLAVLLGGEGWHNNHHAFPSAAYLRFRPREIDVVGSFILLLGKLGLARKITRLSRRARPGAA
jgi:stearoyl-CoA desaturase (delta-9 desaturase)